MAFGVRCRVRPADHNLRLPALRPKFVPTAVGLYIVAAYWFTASTSFANPAVTIARALTDTFAGIAPGGVLSFIVAQLAGAAAATSLSGWLLAREAGNS